MAKKTGDPFSKLEQERNRKDSGFGTATTSTRARLILPDGRFNVTRNGQSFSARLNLYHRLITMPVFEFVLVIALAYFLVNLVFAGIYYSIGLEHLSGIDEQTKFISPFWGAFFFSSQTLTTVGYGHISPLGSLTNVVAAIEALVGLMMFALITGLVYGLVAVFHLALICRIEAQSYSLEEGVLYLVVKNENTLEFVAKRFFRGRLNGC